MSEIITKVKGWLMVGVFCFDSDNLLGGYLCLTESGDPKGVGFHFFQDYNRFII